MTRELTEHDGKRLYGVVAHEDELRHALWSDNLGFCLECGTETDGVEPDARQYRCDACGMSAVYGLEELMLMGLVRIGEVIA